MLLAAWRLSLHPEPKVTQFDRGEMDLEESTGATAYRVVMFALPETLTAIVPLGLVMRRQHQN